MGIKIAFKRGDGTYVVDGYHVCPKSIDPYGRYDIAEVEAYLTEHLEALVPEPIPPDPTQVELEAIARASRDAALREIIDRYNAPRWETMNEAERQVVRDYRQALLDWPESSGFPNIDTLPKLDITVK